VPGDSDASNGSAVRELELQRLLTLPLAHGGGGDVEPAARDCCQIDWSLLAEAREKSAVERSRRRVDNVVPRFRTRLSGSRFFNSRQRESVASRRRGAPTERKTV
jgi:hypothetical protein